jgi:hypothetical protein
MIEITAYGRVHEMRQPDDVPMGIGSGSQPTQVRLDIDTIIKIMPYRGEGKRPSTLEGFYTITTLIGDDYHVDQPTVDKITAQKV